MCGTTRTFDRDIWNSWPERIENVTREQVQAVAQKYLKVERSVTGLLLSAESESETEQ